MGKLVKYCSSCDEGFAERFVFCPVCGESLQAFEMNPVAAEEIVPKAVEAAPFVEPEFMETVIDEPAVEETLEAGHIDEEDIEISDPEEEGAVTVSVPAAAKVFTQPAMFADEPRAMKVTPADLDDGYYITVIEEKNVNQRNMLLLGSTVLCLSVALGATIYSLFDKDLGIGAIDGDRLFSAVIVDEPMTVEEEQIKKDKDKGGGGGGGGREDEDPVSQGNLADQTKNPQRAPDAKVPRLENPLELPPASTEGDRKFPKNFDRYGDPISKFGGLSNGPGTGGGQGTGNGTGQGSGRGTGTGSGTGSGSGGGNGPGNGDSDGVGGSRDGPPPVRAPVTTPLKIISKPRAAYTEDARKNNFTGTVRLKITLLASGSVGSIVPVTRVPYGLTETAIVAARQITFEPRKINGVAQSSILTIEYNFAIY
ncbi:MAG: TonB family protein [Pyrinomonadaceae bacterium]